MNNKVIYILMGIIVTCMILLTIIFINEKKSQQEVNPPKEEEKVKTFEDTLREYCYDYLSNDNCMKNEVTENEESYIIKVDVDEYYNKYFYYDKHTDTYRTELILRDDVQLPSDFNPGGN